MPVPTDRYVATTEFYVRYVETDAMRVVNHAHYVSWLEESRSEYARQRGRSYAQFEAQGLFLAVVEVHLGYKRPARYGDRVQLRTWVEDVKSRTITFGYEIYNADNGELLTTAQTRHICIDADGKVTTIPADWRAGLAG
jgi:acyl-CoA thioester hydrolase